MFVVDHDFSLASAATTGLWIDGWYDGSDWIWESTGDLITSGYVNAKSDSDFSAAPGMTSQKCVQMQLNNIEFGTWGHFFCTVTRFYMCE